MAESIRANAGAWRAVPIRLHLSELVPEADKALQEKLSSLNVSVARSRTPADALSSGFARKVFAAARAEAEAVSEILVWMDPDTVFLKEPRELNLAKGVSFGYRPVHHTLIGSPFSEPPDQFWSLLYRKLSVPERAIFPVVAPVDGRKLRAYFNAGLLVVRPQRGVLRKWRDSFQEVYRDPAIAELCKQDRLKLIFLHQAALASAVLCLLEKGETAELPPAYNYPLNLHAKPDPIGRFVTIRYEDLFRERGWSQKVQGPAEMLSWLKARFPED